MIRFYKVLGAIALAAGLTTAPTASFAGVFIGIGISVNTAPPILPVYEQPPCPAPDLIWTPGYWAYSDYAGYYWVPGAWVPAPEVGFLWTPGYWGYGGGVYAWHPGYWGRHVGFYGGVNYGFGYFGSGFYGGGWSGNHFRYNTAYVNVNRTVINNVYVNRTVVNNYGSNRVAYNGGPRGVRATPTAQELAYRNETHVPATSLQREHIENAAHERSYLASVNHGVPPEAAARASFSNASRPSYAEHSNATEHSSAYRGTTSGAKADPFERFNRAPQAGSAYHPPAYHANAAYHAPAAYRAAPAYHAQTTYHAPAYHARASYQAGGGQMHGGGAGHAGRAAAPREDGSHRER